MMGRDEEAVALCRSFVARHPLTEWTPGVRFWIGEYGYNHGAFDDAEEQFRTVADAYPRHELAGEALFWAGRSAARRKEYLRAIEHYTRLAKDYPDSPRMAEARFFQGDALTELGEFAKAILIMDEIITKHRDSPLVASAWGRKGDCQFTLGAEDPRRYAEAIESYRAALGMADVPLDLRLQAECKIGRCLEKLNQPDQAVEQYYARVVAPYLAEGAGRVSPAAAVWFTRAAFGAADILAGQKKWRPAARMLERVVESGVSAARDAQDRLDRLKAEHWMLF
jgi:tetratricopeptide (TPR) repeat protein